jgi:hypothetical protein
MGPLTYSLCHKPVIGLVMYITSACAFPPLFYDEAFPLQQAGSHFVKAFDAPVGKAYSLQLGFHFPSAQAMRADAVVGSRYDPNCERPYADIPETQREGLGRPIPIRVLVREKRTGKVTLDRIFDTLCRTSSASERFKVTRTAARIELAEGSHVVEIWNMASHPGLEYVRTTVSLVPGDGK